MMSLQKDLISNNIENILLIKKKEEIFVYSLIHWQI